MKLNAVKANVTKAANTVATGVQKHGKKVATTTAALGVAAGLTLMTACGTTTGNAHQYTPNPTSTPTVTASPTPGPNPSSTPAPSESQEEYYVPGGNGNENDESTYQTQYIGAGHDPDEKDDDVVTNDDDTIVNDDNGNGAKGDDEVNGQEEIDWDAKLQGMSDATRTELNRLLTEIRRLCRVAGCTEEEMEADVQKAQEAFVYAWYNNTSNRAQHGRNALAEVRDSLHR